MYLCLVLMMYTSSTAQSSFKNYVQTKTYLDNAKITIPDEKTPVWINGQADLVVKKGDLVTVYDYKSDKRNGKPIPDFEDALFKKYEGQLALYRYAIGKSFGLANVKADKDTLIHLYM